VRKKFSRKQLLHFTANLQVELIGMEACGGSHFLGRALQEQGHEVRLMPAQYVKPYVKSNKSHYIDAEAIAEAVGRPRMRFVPIKTDEQLDLQSLHRVREPWVMRRTAVVNQIRGLLFERGITLRRDGAIWKPRCRGSWKTPQRSCRAHCACCCCAKSLPKYEFPRLLIPSGFCFPPVVCSPGTTPSQAANSRPCGRLLRCRSPR
jgi:hypothetical protein